VKKLALPRESSWEGGSKTETKYKSAVGKGASGEIQIKTNSGVGKGESTKQN